MKVTVLGLARSGVSAALALNSRGASVFGSDAGNPAPEGVEALRRAGIAVETGGHSSRALAADLVVLSPGIPLTAAPVVEAKTKKVPVISEIELAYHLTQADIVAITGSNGKTTTTALTGALLRRASFASAVGGNIGDALSGQTQGLKRGDVLVAEVSSFQLDSIREFRPRVALITNLTPDHLDRYASEEDYYAAKWRIAMNQGPEDLLILNEDDPNTAKTRGKIKLRAKVWGFSSRKVVEQGAFVRGDLIVFRDGARETEVLPAAALGIPGPHNLMNALAALLVAFRYGIEASAVAETLRNFKGVEHRLEFVARKREVAFYNDSKATNLDSVRWALLSLPGKIRLIAGGRDKAGDFASIKALVSDHVAVVYALGEAAGKIEAAWGGTVPVRRVHTMDEAVRRAFEEAGPGETVLLSPACASFDMYKNYEERGRHFKTLVGAL